MTVTQLVTREPRPNHGQSPTRSDQSLIRPNTEAPMQLAQVLDVIERLLRASNNPDFTEISRYGTDTAPRLYTEKSGGSPAGVAVKFQSGSEAYLWGAEWPGAVPIETPAVLPPVTLRGPRLAVFVVQLLDVARPEEFTRWRLVAFPDLGAVPGVTPVGVQIGGPDGTTMLLWATAAGGPFKETDVEPFPDYRIPLTL